ncbi:MAG: hypothetical protein HRT94_07810 [Alphaproteobacteria bacterium]|nr:hypothetical protein [Alphaproteobacteria bacterium]
MNTQNGNVLWFILLAIILLGLLTSMLNRSGSSTNETGAYEQGIIKANEVLTYLRSIEDGIQKLVARGCSENEFDFHNDNDNDGDYYDNEGCCTASKGNPTNSPPNEKCHIFAPGGAGLPYLRPIDQGWSTATWPYPYGNWFFSTWNRAPLNDNSGSQYRGIIAGLSDVEEGLCLGINNQMGIENPSGSPPDSAQFFGGTHFQGTYGNHAPAIFSTSGNEIDQKKAGCFRHDTGGGVYRNGLFYVLYMRVQ